MFLSNNFVSLVFVPVVVDLDLSSVSSKYAFLYYYVLFNITITNL